MTHFRKLRRHFAWIVVTGRVAGRFNEATPKGGPRSGENLSLEVAGWLGKVIGKGR
jgi:hypothetical protein